jgi:hypothetical protein
MLGWGYAARVSIEPPTLLLLGGVFRVAEGMPERTLPGASCVPASGEPFWDRAAVKCKVLVLAT